MGSIRGKYGAISVSQGVLYKVWSRDDPKANSDEFTATSEVNNESKGFNRER